MSNKETCLQYSRNSEVFTSESIGNCEYIFLCTAYIAMHLTGPNLQPHDNMFPPITK